MIMQKNHMEDKKELMIVGAGGFGREVAWLVERINKVEPSWNLLGFIDEDEAIQGKCINGYEVLGTIKDLEKYENAYVVCAIGASITRKNVIEKIKAINPSIRFATLIDPSVEMSNYVEIGDGTIICAHTIITVNVVIGEHVIINLDCTIGHDVVLGNFNTLYPSVNVSGNTQYGECVELGTGTQIIQGKTIGDNTIVGAGAVVVRDLPANCTAVGSPAKPIKFRD